MGISGLLPVLKSIQAEVHLQKYKGEKIGVDAYVWLHRGAFGCAFELATGKPTKKYVDFCMKRVRLLLDSGITPVIVLDGANLPMKSLTEQSRKELRVSKKLKGLEYLKAGDRTKAIECFQTCIDVTPLMAFEFIKALKAANIEFIVAPYEADAQLAFLNLSGYISAVLTEDSDLISFGCTKVLYKLRPDGYCIEILKESLGNIKEMRFWSSERFRQMCILSGCDYLNSIPGIGVKTAMKHLEKTDAYSLMKSWKTWGSTIKAPKMPPNYLESFLLADQTFQFQRVYDPKKGKLVTLNPIPSHVKTTPELMHAIGPDIDANIAKGIAEGFLNPETKEPYPFTNLSNQILKNRNSSNISSTLSNCQQQSNAPVSSINIDQRGIHNVSRKSTDDQQMPILNAVSNIENHIKSDLKEFAHSNLSKIKESSISGNSSSTIKISAKLNQNNTQCKLRSDQNNSSINQLKSHPRENQKNLRANLLEANSNLKHLLKPPFPTIRSSYSKIVMGGISKIVPSKRKSNQEIDKTVKPQKKISSFFGVPRLSPHFPPSAPKPIATESLITKSKKYTQIDQGRDNGTKDPKPTGILNLLNPQKGRARRVGLAPVAKKNS